MIILGESVRCTLYDAKSPHFMKLFVSLGTVFAVTGGLAAPALAAGIGGLASLTGAGTASSTAILAVLATFKAGELISYLMLYIGHDHLRLPFVM